MNDAISSAARRFFSSGQPRTPAKPAATVVDKGAQAKDIRENDPEFVLGAAKKALTAEAGPDAVLGRSLRR